MSLPRSGSDRHAQIAGTKRSEISATIANETLHPLNSPKIINSEMAVERAPPRRLPTLPAVCIFPKAVPRWDAGMRSLIID